MGLVDFFYVLYDMLRSFPIKSMENSKSFNNITIYSTFFTNQTLKKELAELAVCLRSVSGTFSIKKISST